MNKQLVMRAIAREMDYLYNKVICNPKNEGKDLTKQKQEIAELYEAYMELRGHKGMVVFVLGLDTEACNVDSIYQLTRE